MWTRAAFSPCSFWCSHARCTVGVCGCGDVDKACVLAFCGSGAHVFVSDSEILKNTGHFNDEIDFAGSEFVKFEEVVWSNGRGQIEPGIPWSISSWTR